MATRLWPLAVLASVAAAAAWVCDPATVTTAARAAPINPADTAWVLTATALVLLMTPGLAFFYGGLIGRRHIVPIMFQSFLAMGVVSLAWVGVGFSLAFGHSLGGVIGDPRTFLLFRNVTTTTDAALAPTIPLALFALFQMKFAVITPALVSGAFGERIRFGAYVLFMLLFSLLVYAPLAHWTWHPDGLLHNWGVLDFAGGTVVHMTAGFAGLAGALLMRRREPHPAEEVDVPLVLLGTGLLWFGWFGFNAGSALAAGPAAVLAFLTTNTAAAAAMVAWLLLDVARGRQPGAVNAAIAAVVGLVAVTPAAGYVTAGASVLIGIAAALVSNVLVNLPRLKDRLADTLDVFACHGVGGTVGMVLTAVFATEGGVVTGHAQLLWKHLAAVGFVAVFTLAGSALIFKVIDATLGLQRRVSAPGRQCSAERSNSLTSSASSA